MSELKTRGFTEATQAMREWRDRQGDGTAAIALRCRVEDGEPRVSGYLSEMTMAQSVALATAIIRNLSLRTGAPTTPVALDPGKAVSDEGTPRPDVDIPPPSRPILP